VKEGDFIMFDFDKDCSDCDNLNVKDKKCDGVYKCKITKKYVNACNHGCDKFKHSWRSMDDKKKYYYLGKEAKSKEGQLNISPLGYFVIFILLLIIWLVAKLSGY
jgi:hypothetical protein